MNSGDIVLFTDGSYSLEMTSEGLKDTFPNMYPENKELWKVIETGLKLPADNSYNHGNEVNNTIVQNVKNPNRYMFTQKRFIRLHRCTACNRDY